MCAATVREWALQLLQSLQEDAAVDPAVHLCLWPACFRHIWTCNAWFLWVQSQVQSIVMVGDPQQLPPTVRCQEAQRLGLGYSLFERVQAMGLKPLLLDTQYRMHPKLAEFPSAKFYSGLLQSWPKPADRPLPQGLPWPNPQVCARPVLIYSPAAAA